MRPFRDHVGDLVWQVPPGRVSTFGDLARALGDIRAARAVAAAISDELDPDEYPTHRIVRKDGSMGAHPLGEGEKARRLASEGVGIVDGRVDGMAELRLVQLISEGPLREMRRLQAALGERLHLGPLGSRPRTLMGVDVAYSRDGHAHAAAVVTDARMGTIVATRFGRVRVDLPYIPTYLAFREMPAIEAVLDEVDTEGALVFVDGQGILHPRGFGIACHVGVSLGLPSVGVAKSALTGSYDRDTLARDGQAEVLVEGEHRGWALARGGRERRAVFVSPGHRVSVEDSLRLTREAMGERQPRPLELAHAAATAARREWEAHSTTSRVP